MDKKEMTNEELYFAIKNKLAAYTNGPIIREAEALLDQLYKNIKDSSEKKEDVRCFRGIVPKTTGCNGCQYISNCKLI